ncbi:uncharacterized protein DUF4191 [Salana multivorans]|uniref:Uncharacterized protein DUF4191 n=1 Tax=Salana multivorans TaxID=120377 RepID=A0A3N2D1T9_9MICO|nr:DUF4191 domain-containing protein [Salana multivorans]MBN8880977.1 DUF4191 domain-containing protein [Salana multivorans]OJX93414.1 MAG: hypothetical protein BGO96_10310 [Micrococcales bacterium 73-15]ROR93723.1 uncharacterized protein DUF4191 [Salana multivorans]
MARKDSSTPAPAKKRRWYHQLWDVFQMTRKSDPAVTWWILGSFLGVVALGVLVGFLLNPGMLWYFVVLAIPFGLLAAMFILSRRAEKAAYGRIEGQPGAVSAALGTIRRGWSIEEQPVAVDPRTQAMVFRAIGKPGVVLVGEGGSRGVQQRLLEGERKRVLRLIPEVPVHLIQSGREEGQVPLPGLVKALRKQKGNLTKLEVAEVSKRLAALAKLQMPMPKGVDPMRARPDRKAMRGR